MTSSIGGVGISSIDGSLVDRAARGDVDAFDSLLAPRLERLVRIARAIVRDDWLAREAVQDACVRAWQELPNLRDPDRFEAWLTQIVVNGCRSQLRRTKRREIREIALDRPDGDGRVEERATGDPLLGDAVVDAAAVQRAFGRLNPDHRTLLVLHYVDDRPVAEIAGLMRVPVGTVKWRLSRARDALERALEAER